MRRRPRLQIGVTVGISGLVLSSAMWAHEEELAASQRASESFASAALDAASASVPQAGSEVRFVLATVYVAAAFLVSRSLIARERRFGRFTQVPRSRLPRGLTQQERERLEREQRSTWIAEHLAGIQAEVAGAIFHAKVGPPEVAALLARLEAEGKITSATSTPGGGAEKRLVAPRDTLSEHERALTDAIFFDGPTTSMARIAAHYRKRGLSAPAVLRPALEQRAVGIDGLAVRNEGPSCLLAMAAFIVVWILNFGLFALTVEEHRQEESWLGGATALASLGCLALGPWLARRFREDFVTPEGSWRLLRAFLAALITGHAYLLLEATTLSPTGSLLSFSIAFLLTGWVTRIWWWRGPPGVVATRRRIGIAHRLLEAQLADDVRVLEPKWRPHLIALDLLPANGCWLRDIEAPRPQGTATVTRVPSSSSSSSWSSSSSSSGSRSSSFSGGGGRFGGGGASGSW